ncbi:hypothetical protein AYL99_11928 [Fonsecaea erecta]|uniref:Uncharacterized protein n=1 Tax=Fonsecaea erecta TaxID=1367422 RepID=A0A178Z3A8_9EURO|nr:hypothetical protein AYL99_11928 [Fonsecaea erecta]OAP53906.1 hypothetical protein AYL99_11928 [Fonsecaea erecta]
MTPPLLYPSLKAARRCSTSPTAWTSTRIFDDARGDDHDTEIITSELYANRWPPRYVQSMSLNTSCAMAGARLAERLLKAAQVEKGVVECTFVDSPLYKNQGIECFSSKVELGPGRVQKIHPVGRRVCHPGQGLGRTGRRPEPASRHREATPAGVTAGNI